MTTGFRMFFGWGAFMACFIMFTHPVNAFEVSPGAFDFSIGAGSSTRRQIVIKNTDAETTTYFLTVQKFRDGGNGRPVFLDPSDAEGLPTWLRVSEPEFVLVPGQEKRVMVQIDVPKAAVTGGEYAAVFVTERPLGSAPFGIARRIGTLFLVAVNGEPSSERMEIQGVDVGVNPVSRGLGSLFGLSGTVSVEADVRNSGNVHGVIGSRLVAEASGIFGSKTVEATSSMRLLPGERRRLSVDGALRSPIGFVTATIELGNGRRQVTSKRLYVLPSAYVIASMLVILVGGGSYVVWRKRRHHLSGG